MGIITTTTMEEKTKIIKRTDKITIIIIIKEVKITITTILTVDKIIITTTITLGTSMAIRITSMRTQTHSPIKLTL